MFFFAHFKINAAAVSAFSFVSLFARRSQDLGRSLESRLLLIHKPKDQRKVEYSILVSL